MLKPFDYAVIKRSVMGNTGKRCQVIDLMDGAERLWWVVVIGGTVAEGLIPEADLAPEPVRVAA